jgi:phosphoribosylanthranilate isomerase
MSDIDSASGALETAATALKKLKALEDATDLKAAVDGLGKQIQGLVAVQHNGRKEATEAHGELLEAVRALTKAINDAAAQDAADHAKARKLSLMQTHATLLATLTPEAYHTDHHANRALVLMAKVYGYTPKETNGPHVHQKVSEYEQAKEAKQALVYLTAGYKHGGVSYQNIECV